MKEKINKYNSSNQTTRKQPKGQRKVYEYEMRRLTGVRFNDLEAIFNCEFALKLMINYGGVNIYIPNASTLKRDIKNIWTRYKYNYYINMGANPVSAIEQLSSDLNMTRNGTCHILGKLSNYREPEVFYKIFKMKLKEDMKLLKIIAENFNMFIESKIIEGKIMMDFNELIIPEFKVSKKGNK